MEEELDYKKISEELLAHGWEVLTGNGETRTSMWQHKLIERRFKTYDAALCHNLLVIRGDINVLNPETDNIYKLLNLFADGWSTTDSCELSEYVWPDNNLMMYRQNSLGGKELTVEDAIATVDKKSRDVLSNVLSTYFYKYYINVVDVEFDEMIITTVEDWSFYSDLINRTKHERKVAKLSEAFVLDGAEPKPEGSEQVALDVESVRKPIVLKKAFVIEGDGLEGVDQISLVVADRYSRDCIVYLKDKIKALVKASNEADKALERVLALSFEVKEDEEND